MQRDAIERLLPDVFQRTALPGSPLYAILEVMEILQAPAEAVLQDFGSYFNPYHTPDRFVPFLAYWVDLDRFFQMGPDGSGNLAFSIPSGLGRLRELIAAAVHLSQWRGTLWGLRLFLETATGVEGFEIDEGVVDKDGRQRPFHVRFRVPPAAAPYRVLIERIIEQEKPAYVTYEITVAEQV